MRLLAATLLLLIVLPVQADVLDELARRDGISGVFSQRVSSDTGDVLAESSGQFALRKPGLFRWQIESPDRQLIVVDGEWLWQHDMDLETLLRRPAPAGEASPLQLLTADRQTLEARYRISEEGEGLRLTPRTDNDFFSSLLVLSDGNDQLQLVIDDNLGQRVSLDLTLDDGPAPEPARFQFTPPEAVTWLEGAPLLPADNSRTEVP